MAQDKDNDEASELRSAWVEHEYTKKMKAEADKSVDLSLLALLTHCRTSTDIKVLEKYYQYERFKVLSKLMSGAEVRS